MSTTESLERDRQSSNTLMGGITCQDTDCTNCNILTKKLGVSREWNKFYQQKLENTDKFLHIVADYEREKQRNVELQLTYDQRSRECSYIREQMANLLLEVEPLRAKLRQMEKTVEEEMKRREKAENQENNHLFTIEQQKHQILSLKEKVDTNLVEILEKKLNSARSEIKRLKNVIDEKTGEISELKDFIDDRRLHFERNSKKALWSLKVARDYGLLLYDRGCLPGGIESTVWQRLHSLLKVSENVLCSQYKAFREKEERKYKKNLVEIASLPSLENWLDDFDVGLSDLCEDYHYDEDIKNISSKVLAKEAKQLDKLIQDSEEESKVMVTVAGKEKEELKKKQVKSEGVVTRRKSTIQEPEKEDEVKVSKSKLAEKKTNDQKSKNVGIQRRHRKEDKPQRIPSIMDSEDDDDININGEALIQSNGHVPSTGVDKLKASATPSKLKVTTGFSNVTHNSNDCDTSFELTEIKSNSVVGGARMMKQRKSRKQKLHRIPSIMDSEEEGDMASDPLIQKNMHVINKRDTNLKTLTDALNLNGTTCFNKATRSSPSHDASFEMTVKSDTNNSNVRKRKNREQKLHRIPSLRHSKRGNTIHDPLLQEEDQEDAQNTVAAKLKVFAAPADFNSITCTNKVTCDSTSCDTLFDNIVIKSDTSDGKPGVRQRRKSGEELKAKRIPSIMDSEDDDDFNKDNSNLVEKSEHVENARAAEPKVPETKIKSDMNNSDSRHGGHTYVDLESGEDIIRQILNDMKPPEKLDCLESSFSFPEEKGVLSAGENDEIEKNLKRCSDKLFHGPNDEDFFGSFSDSSDDSSNEAPKKFVSQLSEGFSVTDVTQERADSILDDFRLSDSDDPDEEETSKIARNTHILQRFQFSQSFSIDDSQDSHATISNTDNDSPSKEKRLEVAEPAIESKNPGVSDDLMVVPAEVNLSTPVWDASPEKQNDGISVTFMDRLSSNDQTTSHTSNDHAISCNNNNQYILSGSNDLRGLHTSDDQNMLDSSNDLDALHTGNDQNTLDLSNEQITLCTNHHQESSSVGNITTEVPVDETLTVTNKAKLTVEKAEPQHLNSHNSTGKTLTEVGKPFSNSKTKDKRLGSGKTGGEFHRIQDIKLAYQKLLNQNKQLETTVSNTKSEKTVGDLENSLECPDLTDNINSAVDASGLKVDVCSTAILHGNVGTIKNGRECEGNTIPLSSEGDSGSLVEEGDNTEKKQGLTNNKNTTKDSGPYSSGQATVIEKDLCDNTSMSATEDNESCSLTVSHTVSEQLFCDNVDVSNKENVGICTGSRENLSVEQGRGTIFNNKTRGSCNQAMHTVNTTQETIGENKATVKDANVNISTAYAEQAVPSFSSPVHEMNTQKIVMMNQLVALISPLSSSSSKQHESWLSSSSVKGDESSQECSFSEDFVNCENLSMTNIRDKTGVCCENEAQNLEEVKDEVRTDKEALVKDVSVFASAPTISVFGTQEESTNKPNIRRSSSRLAAKKKQKSGQSEKNSTSGKETNSEDIHKPCIPSVNISMHDKEEMEEGDKKGNLIQRKRRNRQTRWTKRKSRIKLTKTHNNKGSHKGNLLHSEANTVSENVSTECSKSTDTIMTCNSKSGLTSNEIMESKDDSDRIMDSKATSITYNYSSDVPASEQIMECSDQIIDNTATVTNNPSSGGPTSEQNTESSDQIIDNTATLTCIPSSEISTSEQNIESSDQIIDNTAAVTYNSNSEVSTSEQNAESSDQIMDCIATNTYNSSEHVQDKNSHQIIHSKTIMTTYSSDPKVSADEQDKVSAGHIVNSTSNMCNSNLNVFRSEHVQDNKSSGWVMESTKENMLHPLPDNVTLDLNCGMTLEFDSLRVSSNNTADGKRNKQEANCVIYSNKTCGLRSRSCSPEKVNVSSPSKKKIQHEFLVSNKSNDKLVINNDSIEKDDLCSGNTVQKTKTVVVKGKNLETEYELSAVNVEDNIEADSETDDNIQTKRRRRRSSTRIAESEKKKLANQEKLKQIFQPSKRKSVGFSCVQNNDSLYGEGCSFALSTDKSHEALSLYKEELLGQGVKATPQPESDNTKENLLELKSAKTKDHEETKVFCNLASQSKKVVFSWGPKSRISPMISLTKRVKFFWKSKLKNFVRDLYGSQTLDIFSLETRIWKRKKAGLCMVEGRDAYRTDTNVDCREMQKENNDCQIIKRGINHKNVKSKSNVLETMGREGDEINISLRKAAQHKFIKSTKEENKEKRPLPASFDKSHRVSRIRPATGIRPPKRRTLKSLFESESSCLENSSPVSKGQKLKSKKRKRIDGAQRSRGRRVKYNPVKDVKRSTIKSDSHSESSDDSSSCQEFSSSDCDISKKTKIQRPKVEKPFAKQINSQSSQKISAKPVLNAVEEDTVYRKQRPTMKSVCQLASSDSESSSYSNDTIKNLKRQNVSNVVASDSDELELATSCVSPIRREKYTLKKKTESDRITNKMTENKLSENMVEVNTQSRESSNTKLNNDTKLKAVSFRNQPGSVNGLDSAHEPEVSAVGRETCSDEEMPAIKNLSGKYEEESDILPKESAFQIASRLRAAHTKNQDKKRAAILLETSPRGLPKRQRKTSLTSLGNTPIKHKDSRETTPETHKREKLATPQKNGDQRAISQDEATPVRPSCEAVTSEKLRGQKETPVKHKVKLLPESCFSNTDDSEGELQIDGLKDEVLGNNESTLQENESKNNAQYTNRLTKREVAAPIKDEPAKVSHPGLVGSLARLGTLDRPRVKPKPKPAPASSPPHVPVPASSGFVDSLFSKKSECPKWNIVNENMAKDVRTNFSVATSSYANNVTLAETNPSVRKVNYIERNLGRIEDAEQSDSKMLHMNFSLPHETSKQNNDRNFVQPPSLYGSHDGLQSQLSSTVGCQKLFPDSSHSSGPSDCRVNVQSAPVLLGTSLSHETLEPNGNKSQMQKQSCVQPTPAPVQFSNDKRGPGLNRPGGHHAATRQNQNLHLDQVQISLKELCSLETPPQEEQDDNFLEALKDLLSYKIKSRLWCTSIDNLCDSLKTATLVPLIRNVIECILEADPNEMREMQGSLPPSLYKLFQAVCIVEVRLKLPPLSLIKLSSRTVHNLVCKPSLNLRPHSLACLALWYTAAMSIPDERGVQQWQLGRSFLIDLLFHHPGQVHLALLTAATANRKLFHRIISYKAGTGIEKFVLWVAHHGVWVGCASVRQKLIKWFAKSCSVRNPPQNPTHFAEELLTQLTGTCDKNLLMNLVTSIVVLARWLGTGQTQEHLLPAVSNVTAKHKQSKCKSAAEDTSKPKILTEELFAEISLLFSNLSRALESSSDTQLLGEGHEDAQGDVITKVKDALLQLLSLTKTSGSTP
ncbi:uncharacterized protein [Cherax quadricarinatus]|uniref:uncharacterized protein isoform X2 n=1 Tax=Cherax quadricarinatus TaxID=27406 RepID=UPI00387E89C5